MAVVYDVTPGQVVAFEIRNAVPGVIAISDPQFPATTPTSVMFSTVKWDQATNQQFQPSLDGSVYIYVFGDRMGTSTVSGFTFNSMCDNNEDGLEQVLSFYQENRAAIRQTPIQLLFGGEAVDGFLIGMSVTAMGSGEESGGMALMNRFELQIASLPKE